MWASFTSLKVISTTVPLMTFAVGVLTLPGTMLKVVEIVSEYLPLPVAVTVAVPISTFSVRVMV